MTFSSPKADGELVYSTHNREMTPQELEEFGTNDFATQHSYSVRTEAGPGRA